MKPIVYSLFPERNISFFLLFCFIILSYLNFYSLTIRSELVYVSSAILIVCCPCCETVSRYFFRFIKNMSGTGDIIIDVVVQKLTTGCVTSSTRSIAGRTPVQVAYLKNSVVSSIRINGFGVEVRFEVGNASPSGCNKSSQNIIRRKW